MNRLEIAEILNAGYVKAPHRLRPRQLQDIIAGWQELGNKVYDDSMPILVPTRDLWKHREYTWTRETSREGSAKIGNKTVELPGHLKWDAIKEDLSKRGWNKKEPLYLDVGGNGGVKVGEGNHRLALAQELGIKEVPVFIRFLSGKVTKSRGTEEPKIAPHSVKEAIKNQPKQEKKKLSVEEQEQIDELMDVLGF